ncbi:FAD-dependent monooxygenase [Mycolicibacterium sp. P9-64]|uniref:FAD-dependent oxidoreductase n=1 Tax=Mycolicibacterium sp. P9-64 TaxID=2024612 RepID=UPI0018D8DBD7|nr:FAD-dependent monooxygenase [Mycolicibacterium sp. P9-64]
MTQRGAAVVCGASMGGLLAARVLADFYESVTLVERDVLPENVTQRRGVPQGRHLHMMLSRGIRIVGELFPGLTDELAAAGVPVVDGSDASRFYLQVGEHLLCRTGGFTDPAAITMHLASRPLLETAIRRRVRAIENVTVLDGHDVVGPIMAGDRVHAVRVIDRESGAERTLDADLTVDATGRAARTPAFLEAHGYERPAEKSYPVGLTYSSQFFRVPPGAITERVAAIGPTLERSTGGGLLAYENDTVILTMIGVAGQRLPADLPGLLEMATALLPAEMAAALRDAEPIDGVSSQHYPASTWRRYDKLRRFPRGFLVLGDAVCSFNPVYGQGMASAALQARALRDCLAAPATDDLSRRFYRAAARKLTPIWQANRMNDFAVTPVTGWRSIPQRALIWQRDKVMAAATDDIRLAEAFVLVLQLVAPSSTLFRPSMLMRIIKSSRR